MLNFINQNKKILVYISLITYWLVLLAATSFPVDHIPSFGVSDKFSHFAAYFGLAVLLNAALTIQDKYPLLKNKSALYTILITSLYGIFDELHQMLIPGRSAEFLDWLADFSGVLLGVYLFKNFILNKYFK